MAADINDGALEVGLETNSDLEFKINRYYYTQDEQGSTVYITDKHQNIRNEYCYDAWGNILDSKEEVHNRITYTGQQFDNITQQYYLRARFYNPVVGRFTQEDIYRGDGLNLYAYCGNNPVVYYDPSGYSCEGKAQASNKSRMDYLREKHGVLTSEDLHDRINVRADIKFSPRSKRSQVKQGGYKTYDVDKYSKAGKGKNRAKGYAHTKEDGLIEAHHPIQDEWAKQWKESTAKK